MHALAVDVAKYFVVLPVLLTVVALLDMQTKKRRVEFVALLLGGGLLSLLIATLSGHFIHDPRPFVVGHFRPLIPHAPDNGFPSDHVLLSSFLGWAILKYSKKFGVACLILAALIGAARMYVGVHHLEDIVGSFVISGVAALAVNTAIAKYSQYATKRQITQSDK